MDLHVHIQVVLVLKGLSTLAAGICIALHAVLAARATFSLVPLVVAKFIVHTIVTALGACAPPTVDTIGTARITRSLSPLIVTEFVTVTPSITFCTAPTHLFYIFVVIVVVV
mmetsp:Transcript_4572/g.6957  ORF Transcript_4572/g.6957 Transcript_4572/m.6957 type:complete len:112 (-) Transcript_4572:25-360(-)